MSSKDIAEARAYSKLDPFGEQRADLRIAQLCCIIANKDLPRNAQRFKLDDFMFDFGSNQEKSDSATDKLKQAFDIGNFS